MLVECINNEAEKALLERLDYDRTSWGLLFMECSRQGLKPDEETVVLTTRNILEGRKASVYFFTGGDIAILWHGAQKSVIKALRSQLHRELGLKADDADRYYDSQTQGEELRLLCRRKQPLQPLVQTNASQLSLQPSKRPLRCDARQAAEFYTVAKNRVWRKQLEILIIEDQSFSAKLLHKLLENDYRTYTAPTAALGWEMYLAQAPDITLLDIELPDYSGHQLAASIHELDAQAYVIMVTSHNLADDVVRAKENGAKGFIIKPYSKQKIFDSIHKFAHDKKLRA